MQFQSLPYLYFLLPLLLGCVAVRLWRKPFLAHPLVFYLKTRLPRAGLQTLLPQLLLGIGLISLLIACLQPVYPFTLQRITRGGLQILLVLDISSSMNQFLGYQETSRTPLLVGDAAANRVSKLDAVKAAVQDFISRRPNDAIGLEVFSINAYVVSPPTLDHESLKHYLTMVDINTLIGEGLTAVGEGLNLATDLITRRKSDSPTGRKGRVVILCTDSEHNYGRNPLPIIEALGKEGVHLYMLGVGLSEKAIGTEIANGIRRTGGEYFDVRSREELNRAYFTIERLEKSRFIVERYVRNSPAFGFFAWTAVLALAGYGISRAIPNWIELA